MSELRLIFQKVGTAKYLSQLDVMRTFTRAFMRAGFPLKFSQGFNPHPRISVAYPLPVGVEGYAEIVDFDTKDDMAPDALGRLASVLPQDIKAVRLYTPERSVKEMAFADYALEFIYDGGVPDGILETFSAENILVMKKSKGGVKESNLRDAFADIREESRDGRSVVLLARLDARNAPINPRYFADALASDGKAPDFARYARLRFLRADGEVFE